MFLRSFTGDSKAPEKTELPSCPECSWPLSKGETFCRSCGFDLRTGKKKVAKSKEKDPDFSEDGHMIQFAKGFARIRANALQHILKKGQTLTPESDEVEKLTFLTSQGLSVAYIILKEEDTFFHEISAKAPGKKEKYVSMCILLIMGIILGVLVNMSYNRLGWLPRKAKLKFSVAKMLAGYYLPK